VRRGYDPRDFTRVRGRRRGPLFACDIAFSISYPARLVPPHPWLTSATVLATDRQHVNTSRPRGCDERSTAKRLAASVHELTTEAVLPT